MKWKNWLKPEIATSRNQQLFQEWQGVNKTFLKPMTSPTLKSISIIGSNRKIHEKLIKQSSK